MFLCSLFLSLIDPSSTSFSSPGLRVGKAAAAPQPPQPPLPQEQHTDSHATDDYWVNTDEVKITSLFVPQYVKKGEEAELECEWSPNKNIYSLKWYFNDIEFFSYKPGDPTVVTLPADGFKLNVSTINSTGEKITLSDVGMAASGSYKCEVTMESPGFLTADKSGKMTVVGPCRVPHAHAQHYTPGRASGSSQEAAFHRVSEALQGRQDDPSLHRLHPAAVHQDPAAQRGGPAHLPHSHVAFTREVSSARPSRRRGRGTRGGSGSSDGGTGVGRSGGSSSPLHPCHSHPSHVHTVTPTPATTISATQEQHQHHHHHQQHQQLLQQQLEEWTNV
ncbi:uncharacterized protein LOC135094554 isoform X2 [Scylla paramamosain]|uniref:uncharacterized protein LOC135094554 isoform X2 n=1 Tax=Scylla paramamosain TaxID=85552 RepID=UPI00308354AD